MLTSIKIFFLLKTEYYSTIYTIESGLSVPGSCLEHLVTAGMRPAWQMVVIGTGLKDHPSGFLLTCNEVSDFCTTSRSLFCCHGLYAIMD